MGKCFNSLVIKYFLKLRSHFLIFLWILYGKINVNLYDFHLNTVPSIDQFKNYNLIFRFDFKYCAKLN